MKRRKLDEVKQRRRAAATRKAKQSPGLVNRYSAGRLPAPMPRASGTISGEGGWGVRRIHCAHRRASDTGHRRREVAWQPLQARGGAWGEGRLPRRGKPQRTLDPSQGRWNLESSCGRWQARFLAHAQHGEEFDAGLARTMNGEARTAFQTLEEHFPLTGNTRVTRYH